MTRDPESVYRSSPEPELPLFEQFAGERAEAVSSFSGCQPEGSNLPNKPPTAMTSPAIHRFERPCPATWESAGETYFCTRMGHDDDNHFWGKQKACGSSDARTGRDRGGDVEPRHLNHGPKCESTASNGSEALSQFSSGGYPIPPAGKASGLSTESMNRVQCKTGASPVSLPAGGRGAAPLKAHARRTDPQTSHEAAKSVRGITDLQNKLRALFRGFGPMNDEQLAEAYDEIRHHNGDWPRVSPSGLRSRRSELVRLNLVEACGEGRTASGRKCTIWRLKEAK